MCAAITRAGFLRGRFKADSGAIRPPWAVGEAEFTNKCVRHLACVAVCPENIIEAGPCGFPEISFTGGECTFCGACLDVCTPNVLRLHHGSDGAALSPWQLQVRIADSCLSVQGVVCRICPDKCDVRAIHFAHPAAHGKPTVDQNACTGCGACVAPCPVGAIGLAPVQKDQAA